MSNPRFLGMVFGYGESFGNHLGPYLGGHESQFKVSSAKFVFSKKSEVPAKMVLNQSYIHIFDEKHQNSLIFLVDEN